MKNNRIPTPTIAEILKEEFLEPLNISAYKLAKDLHVSTSTVLDILHERRRLSVEMALRLSKYFGMSEKFWINLQTELDFREKKEKIKTKLQEITPLQRKAS